MTSMQLIQTMKNMLNNTFTTPQPFNGVTKAKFDTPVVPDPMAPPKATQPKTSTEPKTTESRLKELEARVAKLEEQMQALQTGQAAVKTENAALKLRLQKHEAVIPSLFQVSEEIIKEQAEQAKKLPFAHRFEKQHSEREWLKEKADDRKKLEEKRDRISTIAASLLNNKS